MLAMTRNQDVLKKAQEELDRVVGRERLPDFSDRESLSYVNALVEEVYRWVAGLGYGSVIDGHSAQLESSPAYG